ncbi:hypothetical protein L1987_60424 [Smallanthus sonchifolius]|uniref:Uncharacterized protein n=1 Tax=Smallanthus sonchifolius TaxID=185202 RepID=A0ACB9D8E3_9ASTR|nr:hypothetical protein L1987_60424 [Smallanthus sonchifolius]
MGGLLHPLSCLVFVSFITIFDSLSSCFALCININKAKELVFCHLLKSPVITIRAILAKGLVHSQRRTLEKMLFFSYFKDLVGREVTVELKNDLAIRGTLHSVDQYLTIKLENTRVVDQDKFPHMLSVRNCFIRGSVVRYVQLPPDGVDIELLHDATRREARGG